MSITHRSLMALVLTVDVWDLPLVFHRCYRWRVAPLAVVEVLRMHIAEIPGLLETLTKSLHLSLLITNTNTYEAVEDAFVFRSHIIRRKTIKRNARFPQAHSKTLITENTIRKL